MSTRPNGNKTQKVAHEAKWRKSQDHFECFTTLIGIELEDELSQMKEAFAQKDNSEHFRKIQELFNKL